MASTVILNCHSSASSSSSTAEQPTTGELIQSMLNDAMAKSIIEAGIKQETEDEDDLESHSNGLNMESTSSPSPPFNSSIVSTSGIAKIPLESSASSPDNQTKYSGHKYIQLHRPKIRILHNLLSNKLTVNRKSNVVQVNKIIDVPLIEDVCRGTVKTFTPPPSSALLSSSKRDNPIPEFASWLSDHFKKQQGNDGEIEGDQSPSPFSSRRPSIFNQSVSKDPKSSGQQRKLPAWLLQLSQNASASHSSNIVNNIRTVEIPFNESPLKATDQTERKSQRLSDKSGENGTKTITNKISTGITSNQFKELKTELAKIRKQMCRDRCRFIDESRSLREEMRKMRETILVALQTIQSQNINLNGKRRISEKDENVDEPASKRSC